MKDTIYIDVGKNYYRLLKKVDDPVTTYKYKTIDNHCWIHDDSTDTWIMGLTTDIQNPMRLSTTYEVATNIQNGLDFYRNLYRMSYQDYWEKSTECYYSGILDYLLKNYNNKVLEKFNEYLYHMIMDYISNNYVNEEADNQ